MRQKPTYHSCNRKMMRQGSTSLCNFKRAVKRQLTQSTKALLPADAENALGSGGKLGDAAANYGVDRNYPRRLMQTLKRGDKITRKEGTGPKHVIDEQSEEHILQALKEQAYDLTIRQLVELTGFC